MLETVKEFDVSFAYGHNDLLFTSSIIGAGSSLLAQPSAALQKLVGVSENDGCTVSAFEASHVDPETLMRSPVLVFILGKRDIPACRQRIDAAVRINTVRQYAFEVRP